MTKIIFDGLGKNGFVQPVVTGIFDYDGNEYTEVVIGTQTWLVENLKTTHFWDGTAIPEKNTTSSWGALADNDTDYGWAYPTYNSSYKEDFGLIYSYAVGQYGTIIPGYRLPTKTELTTLNTYTGDDTSLKSSSYTYWNDIGSDAWGFDARGSSYLLSSDGSSGSIKLGGYLHSSTESTSTTSWSEFWGGGGLNVTINTYNKSSGLGIRLIKN